jgi:hypothetical protein
MVALAVVGVIGLVAAMFLPTKPVQQAVDGSPRRPAGEIPTA